MAVERRNPLPVGRYWIDIIDEPGAKSSRIFFFDSWLIRNSTAVKVLKKEELGTTLWSLDYSGIRRNWYLFEVLSPVDWPRDKGFGFPSIVKSPQAPNAPAVTSSTDTAQRPPEPTWQDSLNNMLGDAKTLAFVAIGIYLLTKDSR